MYVVDIDSFLRNHVTSFNFSLKKFNIYFAFIFGLVAREKTTFGTGDGARIVIVIFVVLFITIIGVLIIYHAVKAKNRLEDILKGQRQLKLLQERRQSSYNNSCQRSSTGFSVATSRILANPIKELSENNSTEKHKKKKRRVSSTV